MRHYNKHENLLSDTCLLNLYLPPGWAWQYLDIYHNDVAHIYSAIGNDVYSYSDIFLPLPFLQWYFKYCNHEIVQNYYRFQKYNLIFHQTFCFAYSDFYPWGVSEDYCAMLKGDNKYFWNTWNTHNRTLPFISQSYFQLGR